MTNTEQTEQTVKDQSEDEFILVKQRTGDKTIVVKDLTIKLPDENRTVLVNKFNGEIKQGDRIILTGESGAGKSTAISRLLGKTFTGNGTIEMPELKIRSFSQHVDLPNTTLRGILNHATKDKYPYKDSELRQALERVGLPQLVQNIPGQQIEIIIDSLIEETDKFLSSFKGSKFTPTDFKALELKIAPLAQELTNEQIEYEQFVPDKQRQYFLNKMTALFKDKIGDKSPDSNAIMELTDKVSDSMDEVVAHKVSAAMNIAVKQTAFQRNRARIFWPRLPLTSYKASFLSWRFKQSLHSQFKDYRKNLDTEDPSREIILNKRQLDIIAEDISSQMTAEIKHGYVSKNILSTLFNIATIPLSIIGLNVRASNSAHDVTQILASYLESRILKGNDFSRRLSGGQLKRLMAAGAILSKPDLLVMDEITTGIDDQSKRSVYQAIMDSLPDHTSVISILHDLELTDLHNRHAHIEGKQLKITDLPAPKPGS